MNRKPNWKNESNEHQVRPLEVEVRNDDLEGALKVLKNKISKDGILAELKNKRHYEKKSVKKRRKHREALKKLRKSRGKKARDRFQKYDK